jgi:hypothetical protein
MGSRSPPPGTLRTSVALTAVIFGLSALAGAKFASHPHRPVAELPPTVVANVSPIVPDVSAVMSNITPLGPQISLVFMDVAPLVASSRIVPISHVVSQMAAILSDISPVAVDISPVLAPVNSVVPQVSPIAAQVSILAQRKRRPQHREHHQTYNSSSHIASLVSGALWPLAS